MFFGGFYDFFWLPLFCFTLACLPLPLYRRAPLLLRVGRPQLVTSVVTTVIPAAVPFLWPRLTPTTEHSCRTLGQWRHWQNQQRQQQQHKARCPHTGPRLTTATLAEPAAPARGQKSGAREAGAPTGHPACWCAAPRPSRLPGPPSATVSGRGRGRGPRARCREGLMATHWSPRFCKAIMKEKKMFRTASGVVLGRSPLLGVSAVLVHKGSSSRQHCCCVTLCSFEPLVT